MNYTQNEVISLAGGNPGAMNFLMQVDSLPDGEGKDTVKKVIEDAKTLRGTNLYILHNDLCGRDMDKVVKLCSACPLEVLEDACNRQDRSGRELVAEYLEEAGV